MLLRELFWAPNGRPSPRLLPSRQTRPACCPPFSTSIISTPAGWVGRSAIGGCSSPRRWNSLRPSTIASEAEQPPVWADCGGRSRETGRLPNQLLPLHSFQKPGSQPALYLYSLYIARDAERKTKYILMYVRGQIQVLIKVVKKEKKAALWENWQHINSKSDLIFFFLFIVFFFDFLLEMFYIYNYQ